MRIVYWIIAHVLFYKEAPRNPQIIIIIAGAKKFHQYFLSRGREILTNKGINKTIPIIPVNNPIYPRASLPPEITIYFFISRFIKNIIALNFLRSNFNIKAC